MANWEKLNKEFDDCLDSMTKEDWDNWYKNVEQKRINQNKMKQKEYKPTRQDKSRAEMNAIGAILILIVITIGIIAFTLQTIFNIL